MSSRAQHLTGVSKAVDCSCLKMCHSCQAAHVEFVPPAFKCQVAPRSDDKHVMMAGMIDAMMQNIWSPAGRHWHLVNGSMVNGHQSIL